MTVLVYIFFLYAEACSDFFIVHYCELYPEFTGIYNFSSLQQIEGRSRLDHTNDGIWFLQSSHITLTSAAKHHCPEDVVRWSYNNVLVNISITNSSKSYNTICPRALNFQTTTGPGPYGINNNHTFYYVTFRGGSPVYYSPELNYFLFRGNRFGNFTWSIGWNAYMSTGALYHESSACPRHGTHDWYWNTTIPTIVRMSLSYKVLENFPNNLKPPLDIFISQASNVNDAFSITAGQYVIMDHSQQFPKYKREIQHSVYSDEPSTLILSFHSAVVAEETETWKNKWVVTGQIKDGPSFAILYAPDPLNKAHTSSKFSLPVQSAYFLTSRSNAESTNTRVYAVPKSECGDAGKWTDIVNICSQCSAQIWHKSHQYENSCNEFCDTQGLKCAGAWEGNYRENDCVIDKEVGKRSCDHKPYDNYGGAICQCNNQGISFAPTTAPHSSVFPTPAPPKHSNKKDQMGFLWWILVAVIFLCWAITCFYYRKSRKKVKKMVRFGGTSTVVNDMSKPFLNDDDSGKSFTQISMMYGDVGDVIGMSSPENIYGIPLLTERTSTMSDYSATSEEEGYKHADNIEHKSPSQHEGSNTSRRGHTNTDDQPIEGRDRAGKSLFLRLWPDLKINEESIEKEEKLGQGCFGEIWKGRFFGEPVALKLLRDSSKTSILEEEGLTWSRLPNHPNIQRLIGWWQDRDAIALVTEWVPDGSVRDCLKSGHQFLLRHKFLILRQVASACQTLHQRNFVHRDLALRNVLIDLRTMDAKLSDFGMSRLVKDNTNTSHEKLPIAWSAPECIAKQVYSPKTDVWSYGVMIWEFLNEKVPWKGESLMSLTAAISSGTKILSVDLSWDRGIQDLCKRCWELDENDRPDFDEIYEFIEDARMRSQAVAENNESDATLT